MKYVKIFEEFKIFRVKSLNESLDDFRKTEPVKIDSNEFNQVEKLMPLDDKEMQVFIKVCDIVGYKFLKKKDTSPMNPVISIGTGPMADRVISVKKNDDEQYFIRIFNRSLEDYSLPDKGMTRYYRCDDRETYLKFIDEVLTEFLEYFEDTRDNSRPGSYTD